MDSVQAFLAFLRCEANLAEERANRLRLTASLIQANLENKNHSGFNRRQKVDDDVANTTQPSVDFRGTAGTYSLDGSDLAVAAASREAAIAALTGQYHWTCLAEHQGNQSWSDRDESLKRTSESGAHLILGKELREFDKDPSPQLGDERLHRRLELVPSNEKPERQNSTQI